MILSKELTMALRDFVTSRIDFTGDRNAMSDFQEIFAENWNQAMNKVEDEYDECYEKINECDLPMSVQETENGFTAEFGPLSLSVVSGCRYDNEYGNEALANSLREIVDLYPELSYSGCIVYACGSDGSGGYLDDAIMQYGVDSDGSMQDEDEKTYPVIGEAIASAVPSDEFWEELSSLLNRADEDTFFEVYQDLQKYADWITQEDLSRFFEIAEENGISESSFS